MLHDDITRLAETLDYLSEEQAKQLLGTVLDRLKEDIGAFIIDIWLYVPGKAGIGILTPYLSRSDAKRPDLEPIAMTEDAKSLLAWGVENERPLWLDNIKEGAPSAKNLLDNEEISGRYMDIYSSTRAYAAIPIKYRAQFRGVLSVEAATPSRIKRHYLENMRALERPIGIVLWKSSVFEENRRQTNEAIQGFVAASSKLFSPLNAHRTGFVARPFAPEFELFGATIEKIFQREHIKATSYRHPPGGGLLINEMLEQIHAAHFGIADITGLNANVLIEFGALLATNKPFLIFRNKSDALQLPFDISGFQCYQYEIIDKSVEIISVPNSRTPLTEVLQTFISDKLYTQRAFTEAKEWFSE
jgi:hypothetical protein